jgi:hypothetical protein
VVWYHFAMSSPFSLVPIRRFIILGVFLVVPLCFFLGLYDYYFGGRALLPYMGLTSLLLPLYLLFFELPHIISSYVGFFDREYLGFYRRHLLLWLPIMLIGFAFLIAWQLSVAIVLYLVATMYHVMRQQTGIALLFGVPKARLFHAWSWLTIVITTMMYLTLGVPELVGPILTQWAYQVSVVFLAILGLLSLFLAHRSKSASARFYIGMTWLMLVASYSLLVLGYLFLAIIMIRVIHDVTAFLFYITHEINRNQTTVQNWLYRLVPGIPKALYVVVPALGVGVGLALRESVTSAEAIFIVSMFLALVHYYLESIMWKRDSLHRKYVRVV